MTSAHHSLVQPVVMPQKRPHLALLSRRRVVSEADDLLPQTEHFERQGRSLSGHVARMQGSELQSVGDDFAINVSGVQHGGESGRETMDRQSGVDSGEKGR